MKSYKIFLVAFFFSIPDADIFGFNSYTILCIILFIFLLKELKSIKISFVKLNSPFIYLILYSFVFVFISNLLYEDYTKLEFRYILAKNIEVLNELLLVYFLVFTEKDWFATKIKIRKFVEIYFYINITYLIIKFIYKPIFYYFHSSLSNLNYLPEREYLLGYEPSYSITLMLLLLSLYSFLYKKKNRFLIFSIITIYALIFGGSKTTYLMLILILLIFILYKFLKISKYFIFLISSFLLFSIIYSDNLFSLVFNYIGINDFNNQDKINQYEMISLVTRLESIQISFNLLANNIAGYGIGNSIINLSEYITTFDVNSFELNEAKWTALTPKSQLLEYLLSGGIIFFVLLVKQLRKILDSINKINNKPLFIYLILIFLVFVIGERLPYIFLFSTVYFLSKKVNFKEI